jgi:hypothetical protein
MARPQANNVVLDYILPHGVKIVDIARGLSLLNRKSYRSGYVYSVDFVEYIGHAGDNVRTACLPMSYPLFQSWKMGFDAWREQRAAALEDAEYMETGKWSDFKPFYNEGHLDGLIVEVTPAGCADNSLNLAPLDTTGSEWTRARLNYNDAGAATVSALYVGMLGDDDVVGQYGSLMHAYGVLRSPTLAPDPLTPVFASGSWITKTGEESSDMSTATIDIIEDANDNPPYANQTDTALPPTYVGNAQSAPAGLLMDMGFTGTTGRPVTLDGGLVPLGYIVVNADMANELDVATLRVHCTRGTYKGVAALSMGDFS